MADSGRAERREGSKVRGSEATRCKKLGESDGSGSWVERSSRLHCRRFVLFIILVNGSGGGGNGRRNNIAMQDKIEIQIQIQIQIQTKKKVKAPPSLRF